MNIINKTNFIVCIALALFFAWNSAAWELETKQTFDVYEMRNFNSIHQTIDMSEVQLFQQNGEIKKVIVIDYDNDIQIEPLFEIGE